MRRIAGVGLALLLCMLTWGCSARESRTASRVYMMGEPVPLAPLSYTVLDTEWLDQLGDQPSVRVPQNRFLAIRLLVTNTGGSPSGIPTLSLVDSRGTAYEELNNGEGLTEWLGYLRNLKPAQTQQGRLLFDVPVGPYRLRLVNDAEPEVQRAVLVDIPLHLGPAIPQSAIPASAEP